jgi:hypothetical protein
MEKLKFLIFPGLELRPLSLLAFSHLLYRIRYRDSHDYVSPFTLHFSTIIQVSTRLSIRPETLYSPLRVSMRERPGVLNHGVFSLTRYLTKHFFYEIPYLLSLIL